MTYSRDKRRLPRIAVGSRREPNRFLILLAHDPIFNQGKGPKVTYPGRKVLGDGFLASRGPWLVILHRDVTMGEEPHYAILRLVPVASHWGGRPLDEMRDAARREARLIERDWNEGGIKPATQDQVFFQRDFTGRLTP